MEKYAVITGGSDGIGYAIAEEFAKVGTNICIVGRDENKLNLAKNNLTNYFIRFIANFAIEKLIGRYP